MSADYHSQKVYIYIMVVVEQETHMWSAVQRQEISFPSATKGCLTWGQAALVIDHGQQCIIKVGLAWHLVEVNQGTARSKTGQRLYKYAVVSV